MKTYFQQGETIMELKQVSEKLDELHKAISFAQETNNELKGELDSVRRASINVATEKAADAVEAINKFKSEQAAKEAEFNSELDFVKKKLARATLNGGADELPENLKT